MSGVRLRRISTGAFVTTDGRWAVVHTDDLGWVYFVNDDESLAGCRDTLEGVSEALARFES